MKKVHNYIYILPFQKGQLSTRQICNMVSIGLELQLALN